jgi:hypothetical protein
VVLVSYETPGSEAFTGYASSQDELRSDQRPHPAVHLWA